MLATDSIDPLVGNLPSTLDHSSGSIYKTIFKTACPRIFLGPSWRGLSPGISQRWQWPFDLVKWNTSTHSQPALSCSFCVAVIFQWNLEITEGWLFSAPPPAAAPRPPPMHALPSREKEGNTVTFLRPHESPRRLVVALVNGKIQKGSFQKFAMMPIKCNKVIHICWEVIWCLR